MSNQRRGQQETVKKATEDPKKAVARLTKEIIHECRMIATGCTESCYELVELTKKLMKNEELIGEPIKSPDEDDESEDEE